MNFGKISLLFAAALSLAGCSTVRSTMYCDEKPPRNPTKEWAERVTEAREFDGLKYRIFVPRGIGPFDKVPLVFFFHGAGERGIDNRAQLVHGVPQIISYALREEEKAIVVAPQCPGRARWADTPWARSDHSLKPEPSVNMAKAIRLLDKLSAEYPVDPERIYVTGISMGGYGTWDIISRMPERFAAAMPICGGGDAAMGPRLVNLPILAVHGDADRAVPVENSRRMVNAIREAGGTKIEYREIPKAGHNVWTATYGDDDTLEWLFDQDR